MLLALAGCPQPAAAGECQAGAKPFPTDLVNKGIQAHANLFQIDYHGTYKVISFKSNLATYQSYHPSKAGQAIPPIVLHQCGTTKPSHGDAGITTSAARFFEIPIPRASLAWGGPVPFFEMLGLTEFVHAVDMTYVSAPCTQLMEQCSPSLHMKGGSAAFKAHHQFMTPANGSVVFTDSFGTGFSDSAWDVEFMVSRDPGTLNRAEWISFVAAFFNEEAKAAAVFSKIKADYNALKGQALVIRADTSNQWGGRKPKVAWANSQPETCASPATNCASTVGWTQVSGSWCHCGTLYKLNTANYKRDMVEDAGGQLLSMPSPLPADCTMATNTDGSATLTCKPAAHAAFVSLLAEADVIFDESSIQGGTDGYDTTKHDFATAYGVTAAQVPAFARNPVNIFRLDGSVSDPREGTRGSNWFEGAKAQPQQLLAGMMEALWGDKFQSPCGNKYLRRAVAGQGQEVLGHDACTAYYDAGGSHNCAAIHQYEQAVPTCDPTTAPAPAPAPTPATASGAAGVGLSAAAALAALAAQ